MVFPTTPAVAEGNAFALGIKREVTYGVNPGGAFAGMPISGHSLAWTPNIAKHYSQGVLQDVRAIGGTVAGGMNGALTYLGDNLGHTEMVQNALRGDFAGTPIYTASTIAITMSGNDMTLTDSANGLPLLIAGVPVRIAGADAANNGFKVVISSTVSELVVRNTGGTPQAAGASISVTCDQGLNGTINRSETLELGHPDLGDFYIASGAAFDGFKLTIGQGGFINYETAAIANVYEDVANATASTVSYDSSINDAVFDAHGGVKHVFDGLDQLPGMIAESVTLSFTNGLEARAGIGYVGPAGLARRNFDAKIEASLSYSDRKWFTRGKAGSTSSYSVVVEDPLGNAISFTVLAGVVTAAAPTTNSGEDSKESLMIEAKRLAGTTRSVVAMCRYPAAA